MEQPFFGGETLPDSKIIIGFAKKALEKRVGSHLIFSQPINE
jgi:hypothetical protein